MFRYWVQILPFFIVKWLAKRKCERSELKLIDGIWVIVDPYPDTIFIVSKNIE